MSHMESTLRDDETRACVIVHHQPNLLMEALRKALQKRAPEFSLQDLQSLADPCTQTSIILIPVHQAAARNIDSLLQPFNAIMSANPHAPVLAIMPSCAPDLAEQLIQRKVTGIITADSSIDMMIGALRFALAGGRFAPADCLRPGPAAQTGASSAQAMRAETLELTSHHDASFTPREIEVLHRLRQGLQNKIIAYELGISESTVKVHLRNVMKKLNASNRTQVAFILRRQPHLTSNGAAAPEHAPQ